MKGDIKYRKLKALMVEKGITQQDMSNILGISIGALNRKINGKILWKLNECSVVAGKLGSTIENIFDPYLENKKEAVGR